MKKNKYQQREFEIGEAFKKDGVLLVAVEGKGCKDCFLYGKKCNEVACLSCERDDKKTVIFVPIEKLKKINIDLGEISDGYHTFNELYEFRKVYNAAFFKELTKQGECNVVKSWRHHSGEKCFGGGWFIVVAELPTGQISNHYELKDWDLFQCKEVETAPKWDGHTPQDVVKRITEYLKKAK